jgi:hypothetical protein
MVSDGLKISFRYGFRSCIKLILKMNLDISNVSSISILSHPFLYDSVRVGLACGPKY